MFHYVNCNNGQKLVYFLLCYTCGSKNNVYIDMEFPKKKLCMNIVFNKNNRNYNFGMYYFWISFEIKITFISIIILFGKRKKK